MKLLRNIILLSLFLLVCGCVVEKTAQDGIPIDIDFQVGNSRSDSDPGSADEREIKRLRIMAFYNSGILDAQVFTDTPAELASIPVEKNLTIRSGQKIFCVIANEPTTMTVTLDGITTYDALKVLLLDADEDTYNDTPREFPMACVRMEYIAADRPSTSPVRLPISRAVGKVEMQLDKEATLTYPIRLKNVSVINTPTESRLIPGYPIVSPSLTNITPGGFAPSGDIVSGTPVEMPALYLFEHIWGTGTQENAAALGAATTLKVTVETEKTLGSPTDEFYYFPLIGAFGDGGNVYAVYRNTVAYVSLIYAGEGMKVSYTIADWEDESPFNKVPGDKDGNISIDDWVLPSPDEYEHELK